MPNRAAFVGALFFLATCNAPPDTVAARTPPSPTPSHEAAAPQVPESNALPVEPPPPVPPPRPAPLAAAAPVFAPPTGFVPYGLLGPLPPAPPEPPPKKRRRRPVRPPPEAIPVGLPSSLRSADVRASMARVKTDLERCVQKHPTDPHGQSRLRIKVEVRGATGRVDEAKVEPLFAGTDLARCIERIVATTRYPRFARERLAFSFPIRF